MPTTMIEKNVAITRLTKEKQALEKKLAALEAEKSTLDSQAKDSKDRWLRTAAEFENYRKRSAKEWELLKQQSKTEVILEVLNSLDDFERAFAVVEATDESEFMRGIRLIYNNLLQVLQKLGVTEITVKVHRGNVMRKMGARSLAELVRISDALELRREIPDRHS